MDIDKIKNEQEQEYIVPYHYLVTRHKLLAFPEKLIACPHYVNYLSMVKLEIAPFRGQRILDIGCGDGRLCYELNGEKAVIYGIDYSERAIAFASIITPQIRFQIGDVTKGLPFADDSFDQVVLMETLEHIEPILIPYAMKEIHRVLNYKGELIITVPHLNRKIDSKHYQHFTAEHLRSILSELFKIHTLRGFHNRSLLKNSIFHLLIAAYYYMYPLKILGLGRFVQKVCSVGYLFFEKFLRECNPDDGLALVCKAIKINPFPSRRK